MSHVGFGGRVGIDQDVYDKNSQSLLRGSTQLPTRYLIGNVSSQAEE